MSGLLDAFIAAPETYLAGRGARRVFLSRRDANAYDCGYDMYPRRISDVIGTPAMTGWLDAESEAQERDAARRDAAEDKYCRAEDSWT